MNDKQDAEMNHEDPSKKDPPNCYVCGRGTVPVSMPSGIVVAGYCGDCHVVTGKDGVAPAI